MVYTQDAEYVISTLRPLTTLCLVFPLQQPTEYLNQHDRIGQYIHWCLFRNFGLPHESNWWEHKPTQAIENKNATIFDIQTDNTIQVNRPDIVVKIIMIKLVFSLICLCLVIPLYHTKSKLSKDKDLEIEVTKIWHLKTTTLRAVIGGLGMVQRPPLIMF